jgi:hypothetical protein
VPPDADLLDVLAWIPNTANVEKDVTDRIPLRGTADIVMSTSTRHVS